MAERTARTSKEVTRLVDVESMFKNINVAIVASDADFTITYQNEKCRQLFKEVFNRADYIGAKLGECHSKETTEKIQRYYQDYKDRKRQLDHYVVEASEGKATVVNVPVYINDTFSGMVEFIFESSLA